MRKTTYFCDRCGKEITAKPLTFQATVRDVKAETMHDIDGVMDICESCADDLMAGIRQLIRGEAPEEKTKKKEKKDPIDQGKIRALAKAGWSAAKIADEMRCSKATVYNVLKPTIKADIGEETEKEEAEG